MLSKIRFIDPIIVVGVVISVALAVILVLVGQDQATSLLIGLAVTIITLLIDIIARIKETERAIIQSSEIGTALASDSWLYEILRQVVNDYRKVNTRNYGAFVHRMKAAIIECRDLVHTLSEGYLITDILSEHNTGLTASDNSQKEIKAVQYANPSYWRTPFGMKYLESNKEAIKRGIKITRIWIQNKEMLTEYRDIITAQVSSGIHTLIGETDKIPPSLLEDYSITDDQQYIKMELTLDGQARQERISIDPVEIERAAGNFKLLLRYVRPASEYFEQS